MLIKNIYYLNNKYRNIILLNDIKCLYELSRRQAKICENKSV